MRYALMIAMLAGLVCVGCEKPAPTPKTTEPDVAKPADAGLMPSGGELAPLPPVTKPTPLVSAPMTAGPDVKPMAPAAPAAGGTYTIKKGDTIIKIAREVYGDPGRMKDIQAANPGVNPTKLKIGQVIVLPDVAPKK